MSIRLSLRHPLHLAVALAFTACLFVALPATSIGGEQLKALRAQAEQLEAAGDWAAAADKYEELLRLDRTQTSFRERYQHCLRRFFQVVRFRDSSYQKEVLGLKYPQAMRLYETVIGNLLANALEKDRVSAKSLFFKGLEEYDFALASPEFCADHLGGLKPVQTLALRSTLAAHFDDDKIMTSEEAIEAVREAVMKSVSHMPQINPTTVVLEFLCGACLAVDDYTAYLTPRQLSELCAALKGRTVGVGLRFKMQESRIVVADVLAGSPAADAIPPVVRGDHILGIDGKTTSGMTAEAALELLDGQEDATLELLVIGQDGGSRIVVLRRQELFLPSVHHEPLGNIGYIKIHCFQETTLGEFDLRLAELLKSDCKALLLDLRGNPGGLLESSVEIARRFLPSGVILSTQHQDPKSNKVFRSDNPAALTLPLVVLVDADTASAAEVLAGALKENGRAMLVGQTTHGKGSSQGLLRLPTEGELRIPAAAAAGAETGGIRITIARFLSPTGQPYSGRGVVPDVTAEGEPALYEARALAQKLVR